MEVGMGISLNKLNEKGMRCPMMGGIECMGDSCMLWSWDFDGRESTEYTTVHVALGGEWVKDGDPYDVEEGGLEQRWVRPATGYCGLVKG